ncbi:MAG: hypothetical protein ABJC26_05395 [Gemmatimonadaceae bacterium]
MIENRGAQRALRYLQQSSESLAGMSWMRHTWQRRTSTSGFRVTPIFCVIASTIAFGVGNYKSRATVNVVSLLPADVVARAPTQDDSLYSVVVVAQRSDCSGNLRQLSFLDRTAIARATPHRYLLLAGPPSDTVGLRALLPLSLRRARITVLNSGQRALLNQVGHDESPTMALFDGRNRLLLISATPADPYARTVFVRAVARILSNNPTP